MLLSDKIQAVRTVARRCCLPAAMTDRAAAKVALGHEAHGDDAASIDLMQEIRDELCDVLGYAGILYAQGRRLTWRVALVVALAGIAWRSGAW